MNVPMPCAWMPLHEPLRRASPQTVTMGGMDLGPMARCRSFGGLVIDEVLREVRWDGQVVALGQRAFDVLLVLIDHPDRLVTKRELLRAVWPGMAVEHNNLSVQIGALRRALGPGVISTVPGRGYQFVAVAGPRSQARSAMVQEPPHWTPRQHLPLIGRDEDVAELQAALDSSRLVTLTGAGGSGKSLLAEHVLRLRAQRLPVARLDLDTVSHGGEVHRRFTTAVRTAQANTGEVRAAGRTDRGAGPDGLQGLLLLVDNAEHMLEETALAVQALLRSAPGVRLLVTSQAPLRLWPEKVVKLGSLSVPDPSAGVEEARRHGATALFERRAQAFHPFALNDGNISQVARICASLDGLPLAIELAASRQHLLGLQLLVELVRHPMRPLGTTPRDVPDRHRGLRATLERSHALLDPQAQRVFHRLARFDEGCSVQEACSAMDDPSLNPCEVMDALAELEARSFLTCRGETRRWCALAPLALAYARARRADEEQGRTVMTRRALQPV
jgi:predicted ATPase/DNA-binding winged helix-turn-helix (wHTH) protein